MLILNYKFFPLFLQIRRILIIALIKYVCYINPYLIALIMVIVFRHAFLF